MTEIIFIFAFLFWYGLSLYVSEVAGKKSRFDIEILFFISMIFSPVAAYIIAKWSIAKIKTFEQKS